MEMSQVPRTTMSLVCQLTAQVEGSEAALGYSLFLQCLPSCLEVATPVSAHTTITKIDQAGGHWPSHLLPMGKVLLTVSSSSFQQRFDGRAQDVRKSLLFITSSLSGPSPFPRMFPLPISVFTAAATKHPPPTFSLSSSLTPMSSWSPFAPWATFVKHQLGQMMTRPRLVSAHWGREMVVRGELRTRSSFISKL